MLTITVEFLHGVIRATNHEDTAITGERGSGEWPPSPARLFSAFVAADGTGTRCRVTSGNELKLLELAPPPVIHADSVYGDGVVTNLLQPRYVVAPAAGDQVVQNYPAKSSTLLRPGERMSPRNRKVAYTWHDIHIDDEHLEDLRRRAARIGYLGCADSPVRVTVGKVLTADVPEETWNPADDGTAYVPVMFDGFLDVLDTMHKRFTNGESVRRSQYPKELATYRTPGWEASEGDVPTVVWLRFDRSIPGRLVLDVTETLRAAVLELYERHAAGSREAVPSVLHGHVNSGVADRHVQWLALPNVGFDYSDGRIHGAAIVLPSDVDTDVVEGVNSAVWHLRELTKPDVFSVPVSRWAGHAKPFASAPGRWTTRSNRWVSAYPVVHENFSRKGPTLSDIETWCDHADLPRPIAFRISKTPFAQGASVLRPDQVRRRNDRRPYSHMELLFAEPVSGPVVVGAGRHFGLGLFAPITKGQG